ncbi:MAG: cupin domain-containing protein [Kaistella sp.]
MNILDQITFSTDKANVFNLRKTDKIRYFAVALGKGAILKKHTAPVPSTLLVLKGEINFVIGGQITALKQFDVFEIPVNVEHEVVGLSDENLFTVTQELN